MNKQGANKMNGLGRAGIAIAVVGILVIVWGATKQPLDFSSPAFMSFAFWK